MGDEVDGAFEMAFMTNKANFESVRLYSNLTFVNPDSIYNRESPDVAVTFGIGTALCIVMMTMWCFRYKEKRAAIPPEKWTYWMSTRAAISAAIDNDNPVYTMIKIAAQSIMFLGGIQIDYHKAFFVMLIFFAVESSLDSMRTLLCVYEYKSHNELILTSRRMQLDINTDSAVTQLSPTNVYEDLSRVRYVVVMVFITQFLLISFVVSA